MNLSRLQKSMESGAYAASDSSSFTCTGPLSRPLAAGMQVAALAQRDQLLDDRTQVLRLGQGGDDLLVLDQRGGHVGEHSLAVAGGSAELAAGITVAHGYLLKCLAARDQ